MSPPISYATTAVGMRLRKYPKTSPDILAYIAIKTFLEDTLSEGRGNSADDVIIGLINELDAKQTTNDLVQAWQELQQDMRI